MNYYTDVFKKYAVFNGRATRKEYWMFFLFNFIIIIILGSISSLMKMKLDIIPIIYNLIILVPSLALSTRRLHDTGKSGWWILILLVPFIGTIWYTVLVVTDSDPNSNEYGHNPYATSASTPAQDSSQPTQPVPPPVP